MALCGQQLLHKGSSQAHLISSKSKKWKRSVGTAECSRAIGPLECKVVKAVWSGLEAAPFPEWQEAPLATCWIRLGLGIILCCSSGTLLKSLRAAKCQETHEQQQSLFPIFLRWSTGKDSTPSFPSLPEIDCTAVSQLASLTPTVVLLPLPGLLSLA